MQEILNTTMTLIDTKYPIGLVLLLTTIKSKQILGIILLMENLKNIKINAMDDLLIIPRAILAIIGAILFILFLLFVALFRAVLRQTNMLRTLINSNNDAKVKLGYKKNSEKP
mgnify:CR=1 FL=1